MISAFIPFELGSPVVTSYQYKPARKRSGLESPLAKYFISCDRRHGNPPFFPIPFESVAATIAVMDVLFDILY